jgi:predicted TIM-barrel fold metal-dependent hydrolase
MHPTPWAVTKWAPTVYGLFALTHGYDLSIGFMVYSGVFDRFPKLKLGLLHGGGFFPYHLGRFDQGFKRSSGRQPFPASQPPSRYLKNLYFDNLVYRVETVEYLKRMVGADHIMVGTDYPYTLGDWMAVEKIEQMNYRSRRAEHYKPESCGD